MKILLISPVVLAVNPQMKYAGIERLVYQYAEELVKQNDVTVWGHASSVYPEGIKLFGIIPEGNPYVDAELRLYQSYQWELRDFDIVHDFSHAHLAARYIPNLPSVNPFWHAPHTGKYPKAPYNIIALSEWARREFKRVYNQDSRYMQSIVVDGNVYKPGGERGDRFLTLGVMSPEKGNLAAALLCIQAGVPLDIAGASASNLDYEKAVRAVCDGSRIRYLGEVTEEEKVGLLQSCKALIYAISPGYAEVTSHKIQEALLCGASIITSPVGALPEIIQDGIDGRLCGNEDDFIRALKSPLSALQTREENAVKFSAQKVCSDYQGLYEKVSHGERW